MVIRFLSFLCCFFIFFGISYAKEDCNPEFQLAKFPSIGQVDSESEDKPVFIYFDKSLSMQGYTKDQPGVNNLYINVIDDLQQIAENVGNKTFYHEFGKSIKPIKENKISQVIKPIFYECTDAASECNNQNQKFIYLLKLQKLTPMEHILS